jgi:hypothetical protein
MCRYQGDRDRSEALIAEFSTRLGPEGAKLAPPSLTSTHTTVMSIGIAALAPRKRVRMVPMFHRSVASDS